MSPRASNREALLEGALICLQERGYADTRARDIAEAAGANLASIGYHYGSTEELLAQALIEGFNRWLGEFADSLLGDAPVHRSERLTHATTTLRVSLERNRPLALAFIEALARAPRSNSLRECLADGYQQGRRAVAALLGTGKDDIGEGLASLLIATYDGLLIQWILDPERIPDGELLLPALRRLTELVEAT